MECNREKMLATLKDLGFIEQKVVGCECYCKLFKNGIRLYVVEYKDNFQAYVMVGETQVVIPLTINEFWLYGFNKENGGINYAED